MNARRKDVIDSALKLSHKDREFVIEKLTRSLLPVDDDTILEGAKLAHRQIQAGMRDPSRWVSEEEIDQLLSEQYEAPMPKNSKDILEDAMKLPTAKRAALGEKLIMSCYDAGKIRKIAEDLERLSDADPRPDIPAEKVLGEVRKKY